MKKAFKVNKDIDLQPVAEYHKEASLDDPQMVEDFSFFYCVLFVFAIYVI